jgi:hypothetical protein
MPSCCPPSLTQAILQLLPPAHTLFYLDSLIACFTRRSAGWYKCIRGKLLYSVVILIGTKLSLPKATHPSGKVQIIPHVLIIPWYKRFTDKSTGRTNSGLLQLVGLLPNFELKTSYWRCHRNALKFVCFKSPLDSRVQFNQFFVAVGLFENASSNAHIRYLYVSPSIDDHLVLCLSFMRQQT